MSYKLILDQSLGKNLRRIFRKQIDGALAVANGKMDSNDTAVHAMRKHLKKARAVLQLVREEIGSECFRRQDRRLRNVGRLMTEIRDAEVRWQTSNKLKTPFAAVTTARLASPPSGRTRPVARST